MILSLYIVRNWVRTGRGQFRYIVGKAAPPDFLAQLTYMAAHHDPNILRVDTVLAYHWGMKFLVEVHIALSKDTSLKVAHDIGETLEVAYEKLELVERAFVHLDYEWLHTPEYYRRQKKPDHHKSQASLQHSDLPEGNEVTEGQFLNPKPGSQRSLIHGSSSSKSPAFKIVPLETQFQDGSKDSTKDSTKDSIALDQHSIEMPGSTHS